MATNNSFPDNRQHAVVMGASIAGLMTARVLSNHFAQVTLIEKDTVHREPESRKGQPQTKHLHGLLPRGLNIMRNYFPGLLEEIVSHGANVVDFAESMNWYAYGAYRKQHVLGISGVSISRPTLEHLVRERVLALPNVRLIDNTVVRQLVVTADQQRVTGVVAESKSAGEGATYNADLVVDCMGRASKTPQWLQELGYGEVPLSEVTINVGYTSRFYKRDPNDPRSKNWMVATPVAPEGKRFGGIFSVDGSRWMVTVGGWHGENASLKETEFLDFVKELPNPNIYDITSKCEPLTELVQYKFPRSIRKHYERLNLFPSGYLVLGDAISSFNPIYGQGMTSASIQAEELDKLLRERPNNNSLAKTFFKRISKTIDDIWQMSTGEDFRYPETKGKKPLGIDLINKYVARVHRATTKDEVVCGEFLKGNGTVTTANNTFSTGNFMEGL